MSSYSTADIRNIALIGGPDTGKTSLTEAMLFATGAITRLGEVGDGTTTSDFDEEEKSKGHSIRCSLTRMDHKGTHINLLDTPGYPDFIGEVASALGAVEVAALVVNVHKGLTFPCHTTWDLAGKTGRSRCIVLTHIDQEDDFDLTAFCTDMSEGLGVRCLPVSVPEGVGSKMTGIKAVPFGSKCDEDVASYREALIEAVVEIDDDAMTRFLEEDKPPTEAEAYKLLTRSILAGDVVPVICASPLTGQGVTEFLDFATKALPSPADGPFFKTIEGEELHPDSDGTTLFVFKTVIDPFIGKLCILRVVCGIAEHGHSLNLSRTGKTVKLGHLETMQGKDHSEVHEATAGDLIAVTKIDELETSDTLLDSDHDRHLAPLVVPKPMASRAIEPLDHGDELKLATALRRVVSESPAFSYERNEFTAELVVHGTSIMHIESELHRIKERTGVEVKIAIPRVALKETMTLASKGHYRHKKQTGGRGQFAEVFLEVLPAERGAGLVFEDGTVGGSVPKNFIPAIEKGVVELMNSGIIAGYPVVDVTVRVKDGKFHDVDSDEASFKLAGARAFKAGFTDGKPVLLEPLLDMEIAVPSRFMGAITSDVTSRRGQIVGMSSVGDMQIVRTKVPQREVMTYPTVLHSLTQGEGSFSAEHADYEVVPGNIQKDIMAEYQPEHSDD